MPKCVVFSERAFTSILVETQEKIRTETGGVFLGYRKGDVWYVIESIDPGPNSVFQPAYFEYDQDYINHLINKVSRLYSLQLDLIGLWHRHPGSYDSFSGTDDGTNTKYLRAIENGNTFAEYQYGMKFALGMDGFEKDIQQAYKYLSHAAQAGQSYAMKPLAELLDDEYIPGLSMEDRNSQMIYWFERAVENGEEWAAVTLGRKYENGYTPVQVDVAKAINYYQIAADHDIDMVYLSLGKLYMIPGPTANYKMAHRYLSLAQEKATLDFQIAEIELCYGKMNKDGLGIPKNLEEAHKHFTIAAAKGNADAIEELKHIKKGLFGWKII